MEEKDIFGNDIHANAKLTPVIRQYKEIKDKYKDSLLLFRMGDFYEMFFDDAKLSSDVLGLTLTQRAGVPMAGVPYHSLEVYLSKLIAAGLKIAICEQVEDPKFAKGIVKREVTSVITPGTILENNYLDSKTNNYFFSFVYSKDELSAAVGVCDISTGELFASEIHAKSKVELFEAIAEEVVRFSPREIMLSDVVAKSYFGEKVKEYFSGLYYSNVASFACEYSYAYNTLNNHFKTHSLKGIGIEDKPLVISLVGSMIYYITDLSKGDINHVSKVILYNREDTMTIDAFTRSNLEIISSIREADKKTTLFETIDRTKTSMGSRLLKRMIVQPLLNDEKINKRLEYVDFFFNDKRMLDDTRELLDEVGDLERLCSKLSLLKINPKELLALKKYLIKAIEVITTLAIKNFEMANIEEINPMQVVIDLIDRAILDDPKIVINEGDIIKPQYNETLLAYSKAQGEGKKWISDLEAEYRDTTEINNLKIRYNNIIGYYLEVTKSNVSLVPKSFIKRQTLISSERYTTEKLMEYEKIINEADEKGYSLEYEIFVEVRSEVLKYIDSIFKIASVIANIDVFSSFGFLACEKDYTKPVIDNGNIIEIKEGRHAVVEANLKNTTFIPNDVYLDNGENTLLIITGPNMSGKSTYLRQIALIVLLAQIGSYVPAKYAKIGVVDRIFTRVGANDNIAKGESTFLVEMNETAYILRNATEKSLVIMDEIGRGTSTYDGLSIAWSIIEFFTKNENKKSKVLFATHYHELTMLDKISGVKNYHVSVEESGGDIVFMKRVVQGPALSSYGIYAAKLAGIPSDVTDRASVILRELESDGVVQVSNIENGDNDDKAGNANTTYNISNDLIIESEVEKEIKKLDTNSLTPLEALLLINKWRNLIDK